MLHIYTQKLIFRFLLGDSVFELAFVREMNRIDPSEDRSWKMLLPMPYKPPEWTTLMFAQILNRTFVLDQLAAIERHLSVGPQRRAAPLPGVPDLTSTEFQLAAAEVRDALARATALSPVPINLAATKRGAEKIIEDSCFISSDPVVSLAQSAMEFYFDHPQSKEKVVPGKSTSTPRRRSFDDIPVTDRSLAIPEAAHPSPGRRVFDKFSVSDIGWISSLVAMGIGKFKSPHPFNAVPQEVQLRDRCRLIVVGDWGSGLPRAVKVADAMRKYVDESVKQDLDCHVVHLGDVYYSGWDYEYRDRFLKHWPVKIEEKDKIGSWSLNGNHDMYSGGYGYFDTMLADPRFSRQGSASFFRLFNNQWQFLGLDTAWDDDGLKYPQGPWVQTMVTQNYQRTMIMTHHQLYSAYENSDNVGKVLRERLGDVLEDGKIEGALWGHEHRCIGHKPFGYIKYGRLIGHGGVPVYMTHAKDDPFPSPADYEDRDFIKSGIEHWALMGFAVLDFDGPSLQTRYVNENGRVDRTEVHLRGA